MTGRAIAPWRLGRPALPPPKMPRRDLVRAAGVLFRSAATRVGTFGILRALLFKGAS